MSEFKAVEAFYQGVLGSLPHLPDALLIGAVEERLSPREQNRVETHLGACARCRQDFQALRRFAEQQPSAPAPALVIAPLETPSSEGSAPDGAPVLRVVEVSPTAPVSLPVPKPIRSFLIPGLFLALNAVGLGALYGMLSPKRTSPSSAPPLPTPTATASLDTGRLQAAYERERAQLRGKISQLEKQLQALRSPATPSPTQKVLGPSGLFPPSSLLLDRQPVSLTVHPTVVWKAMPQVHHYTAELFDAKDKPLVKSQTNKAEWRIATALVRGKSYHWKITPEDRSNQPLGKPLVGGFSVASLEQAKRLQEKLLALATELESLNFPSDAQALKARAAMIQKK